MRLPHRPPSHIADPRALIPPPLRHATRAKRLWEIEAEREADAERNEVDLALEQEYEEELELETSLEAELHQMVGFEEDAEDEQKASFTLSPVPPALQQEYKTYTVCHPTHPHPPIARSLTLAACLRTTAWSRSTACATARAS